MGVSVFIFLVSVGSVAAESLPECSLKELTNDCRYFTDRKDQQLLQFSDGSSIRNPFYKNETGIVQLGSYGLIQTTELQKKLQAKQLKLQAGILRKISLKGSDSFNLAATDANTLMAVGSYFSAKQDPTVTVPATISIPWPPESEDVQSVKIEDFINGFLDKLSSTEREFFIKSSTQYAQNFSDYLKSSNSQQQTPFVPLKPVAPTTADQDARVKKLFLTTQSLLLEELFGKRPYNSLSSYEKAVYDKVASVQLIQSLSIAAQHPICSQVRVNAFYDFLKHRVSVCPELAKFPDANLVNIIAHEIAHSIDPCFSQYGAYKMNPKFVSRSNDFAGWKEPLGVQRIQEKDFYFTSAEEDIEKFLKIGTLEEISKPVPPSFYPFSSVRRCLMNNPKFRDRTKGDVLATEQEKALYQAAKKGTAFSSENVQKAATSNAPRYLECRMEERQYRSPQAGETMSDAWAAKTLGRYLETHPPPANEKIAGFMNHALGACRLQLAPSTKQAEQGANLYDAHAYDRFRIDDILLQDERTQKALGCKTKTQNVCLRQIGTNPTTKVPMTSPSTKGHK